MNRRLVFCLLALLAPASFAQNHVQNNDTLTFIAPVNHHLAGTVDLEVTAPSDTSAVFFSVDGTTTSELTDEYARATKTPLLWHTVLAADWFPAGSHVIQAKAVTARGTLTADFAATFSGSAGPLSLDGSWLFASADELPLGQMEGDSPAAVQPQFNATAWHAVAVPNSIDTVDQRWMRSSGLLGTYRRTFRLPATLAAQDVYLKAESCFWTCRYFVNGTLAETSIGGYLPRRIALSRLLHSGTNTIAVVVDSRSSTMGVFNKLRYYYWNYAGLLQDISLEVLPRAGIAEFRAQGTASGALTLRPVAVNTMGISQQVAVDIEVVDPRGTTVLRAGKQITIPPAGGACEPIALGFAHPALWDLEHPNLYTVRLRIAGHTLTEKTGFRDIAVRDGDLLLNGHPVLGLQGFNRHGDYPGLGRSQPDGFADREIKLLHDKGFRIFRPAHYPTTQAELDAADKYGMLVLEEINVTGFSGEQLKNPATILFAESQLQRLIARDRSHPSIFGWSIGNENRTDQPGAPIYVHDVTTYGKTLDPTRPFTEVSAQLRNDICYADMDFLAVNIYAGWYTDKLEDVVTELDALAKYAGDKPMVITEYGAEAVAGRVGTGKGTEYFQALTIDAHNRLLKDRPHFIGKMYWTSTEFVVGPNWDGGNPHPVPPFHTKALLDYYRRPKLGWRVMFSPIEMDPIAALPNPEGLPAPHTVEVKLHNRGNQTVRGQFLITPPPGSTASLSTRPFTLHPGGSDAFSFDLETSSPPKGDAAFGTVRAVIDGENEAMPQLLRFQPPSRHN